MLEEATSTWAEFHSPIPSELVNPDSYCETPSQLILVRPSFAYRLCVSTALRVSLILFRGLTLPDTRSACFRLDLQTAKIHFEPIFIMSTYKHEEIPVWDFPLLSRPLGFECSRRPFAMIPKQDWHGPASSTVFESHLIPVVVKENQLYLTR